MGHLTTENKEQVLGTAENSTMGYVEDLGPDQDLDQANGNFSSASEETPFFLNDDFLPADFCEQTRELTRDIIQYICHHDCPLPAYDRTVRIMRTLVDDALMNRLDFMSQLAQKLDIKSCNQLSVLDGLVTEMFDDDVVTWGRIVTLFAFSGYLARHCEEQLGIPACAAAVSERLARIVIGRLGLWIVANGGWAAFQGQFPAICIFDSTALWKIGGFIGLLCGGVFAFYSSLQLLNP